MTKLDLRHRRRFKMQSSVIPVFFACDDSYVKFMMVTMRSLIDHSSEKYEYRLIVLHTNITQDHMELLRQMETNNVSIEFCNVSLELAKIEKKLSIRDYYSSTTYYRIFIPELYPQYDKVLYIDSDTVVCRDIAELYHHSLGDNYIGAVQDNLVRTVPVYGDYVEKVLNVSRAAYFNAGVALINSDKFRREKMKDQFVTLLNTYSFVVAQDQDYLNILCQDHILWLDSKWNVQMTEKELRDYKTLGLVHYNLAEKPWHHKDCKYGDLFWQVAEKTFYYRKLKEAQERFSEQDAQKDNDAGQHLMDLALGEIANEDNYKNRFALNQERQLTRQEIIEKRIQYEAEGRFDEDLEEDPPSRELLPDEVDYLRKDMSNRMRTRYAFSMARWFMNTMLRKRQLIIKGIEGIENYRNLKGGAIVTCNHFNAFDSFAMHYAYEKGNPVGLGPRKKFFRIIKEGNYTSFPGFYGFLMRNCNTLPLSSNKDTMKKFMKAVDKILQKGHLILIYPEQSLWWNYRKPKPLKKGGFTFAAKNNVPVLPCFITMEDTDVPGEGGLPVQAYTIHVAPPIYPDPHKSKAVNAQEMMEKNARAWKEIYEKAYGEKLTYTCPDEYVKMYLD